MYQIIDGVFMKRAETRLYFQKHCAEQKKSGLTIASYCDKHGIKIAQFYYWKRQLQSSNRQQSQKNFQKILLSPTETTQTSGLSITFPNGTKLTYNNTEFTFSELSVLIHELRRADV